MKIKVEKELIQKLVNAVSNSRRFVDKATMESYRADDVMREINNALLLAGEIGFQNTNPEIEEETRW